MEEIEFNSYSIDDKIQDIVDNLNDDFAKIKASGIGEGGSGGIDIEFNTSLPPPNSENRGRIIYIVGQDGISDDVYICKKLADNSYAWYQIA